MMVLKPTSSQAPVGANLVFALSGNTTTPSMFALSGNTPLPVFALPGNTPT